MFFITKDLVKNLKKSPEEFYKLIIKTDGYSTEPPVDYFCSDVDKRGKVMNFIHISDLHLAQDKYGQGGKRKEILNTAFDLFGPFKKGRGSLSKVYGIISSGDHIDRKHCCNINFTHDLECVMKTIKDIKNRGQVKDVLLVPGNHDVILSEEAVPEVKPFWQSCRDFNLLTRMDSTDNPPDCPVASIFHSTSGVVVFIGFNSTLLDHKTNSKGIGYVGKRQTDLAKDFLDCVQKKYPHTPVMAIGVLHHHLANILDVHEDKDPDQYFNDLHKKHPQKAISSNIYDAKNFVSALSAKGMKLFLHGHQHYSISYDLSYTGLDSKPPQADNTGRKIGTPFTLVPPVVTYNASCCTFRTMDESPETCTLATLKVDFERGLAYYYSPRDRISAGKTGHPHRERSFPIHSLTVSCEEHRLFRNVCNWIVRSKQWHKTYKPVVAKPKDYGLDYSLFLKGSKIDGFQNHLDENWREYHVVPVCLSPLLDPSAKGNDEDIFILNDKKKDNYERNTQGYDLHLVLRVGKGIGNRYEILLNYHVGIERPSMAPWECFLLPATGVGAPQRFVQILRWNILRLLSLRVSEDSRKLETIANKLRDIGRKLSIDATFTPHTIASQKFYKISPTTGHPEILNYNLVQVASFVDNDYSNDYSAVSAALKRIPTLKTFRKTWTNSLEYRLGLVWVPLEKWGISEIDKIRNGDVSKWAEKYVCVSDAHGKQNVSDEIICIGRKSSQSKLDSLDSRIKSIRTQGEKELYDRMRKVVLCGGDSFGDKKYIYNIKNADMSLVTIEKSDLRLYFRDWTLKDAQLPNDAQPPQYVMEAKGLFPAQNYASAFGLKRIERLRKALSRKGRDMLNLKGYLEIFEDKDRKIKFLDVPPPVIEYSNEEALGPIWLICDGLHRIYKAVELAKKDEIKTLTVLAVWPKTRDGWEKCPYYAFPNTWESVTSTENKPPALYTKQHRVRNETFRGKLEVKHKELEPLLKNPRNFYRLFDRNYKPFKMGNQGGA